MSKIFTPFELKEIQKREQGNKSDKTGVFSSRIKPKIEEILNELFPQKDRLKELINKK